jgi:hypothetical protein
MRGIVLCEKSQVVTKAFRALGHEFFSCDLLPCEGGRPEWHIQGDCREYATMPFWDIRIAHPECTFLTSANTYMKRGCSLYTPDEALEFRKDAIDFFMFFTLLPGKVGIENPVGIMSRLYRKPDQYIQPYQFGDDASKNTCLWLQNLPPLKPTLKVPPRVVNGRPRWANQTDSGQNRLPPSKDRSAKRAETYPGIAEAMAVQWGGVTI